MCRYLTISIAKICWHSLTRQRLHIVHGSGLFKHRYTAYTMATVVFSRLKIPHSVDLSIIQSIDLPNLSEGNVGQSPISKDLVISDFHSSKYGLSLWLGTDEGPL